jgi:ataxia telangiectasia mutated family protein
VFVHQREFGDDHRFSTEFKNNISRTRCDAANALVADLERMGEALRRAVVSTKALLLSYINLSNTGTQEFQNKGQTKNITFKELQGRNGNLFNACVDNLPEKPAVPTMVHAIRKDRDYGSASNIVRIARFNPTFSITDSGISRPKIVDCLGTDGKMYRQLVKGGDDMRQDAVMEQVFDFVNTTFMQNDETRRRNLRIRTYKVVPTTPQTGILEWVQNTTAIGSYLTDKDTGAHSRFYPNSWPNYACREHLAKAGKDYAEQRRRLLDIYRNFPPALRFFFLEKFPSPAEWVNNRTAYTRSVAVNSIVGYILGIGDRHAQNILIDVTNGEVVHIDFGIVFDQVRTECVCCTS